MRRFNVPVDVYITETVSEVEAKNEADAKEIALDYVMGLYHPRPGVVFTVTSCQEITTSSKEDTKHP